MRYYQIDIQDPDTGEPITPTSLGGLPISSLLPTGGTNTSALHVEFDIPVGPQHAPSGTALIRIWGLSVGDLGASFNLNPIQGTGKLGALITVSGGMAQGLPLANPAQAGVLVKGRVYQAYGNWIGVEQTVDIQIVPDATGSPNFPVNYSFSWKKGTALSDALSATLKTALPNVQQNISISPNLTLNHDQQGYYASLTQLSQLLNQLSKSIISDPNYAGVNIAYNGQTVSITDFSQPTNQGTIDIQFTDLIGQPTWIAVNTISLKTVMRADINLWDSVNLPPSLVTSSASAFQGLSGNNPANNLNFTGPYNVVSIHHYGSYRQPDASAWCTVFEMVKQPQQTTNSFA